MANVDGFLRDPSEEGLERCIREQLLKIAEHFKLEVSDKRPKDSIRAIIKANLNDSSVLGPAKLQATGTWLDTDVFDSSLTFEQKQELPLLQAGIEQNILDVKKLELEERRLSSTSEGHTPLDASAIGTSSSFDVGNNLRLVPQFAEWDPDTFFSLFERVADSRGWSDLDRTLLLQCVFTGKAQEAYSALTVDDSKVYATVKKAVLTAYELVPEAYRQKFRTWQKCGKQTHVEFARELGINFNRWCASLKISTFVDLCSLVVLEQFKNSVLSHIAVYISEHNVKTAAESAKLDDEYVLIHRGGCGCQTCNDFGYRSGSQSFVGNHAKEEGIGRDMNSKTEWISGGHVYLDPTDICHYCKTRGHWKRECPKRGAQVKSAAFAASEKHAGFVSSKQVEVGRKYTLDQGDFSPFVSDGHASLVGSDATGLVKILRDTGAFNSYIVSSVLPFSEETKTGDHVLMRGMGLLVEPVPLHKLTLTCGLVQGEVIMGVHPALPLEGVDIILGNDLAGGWVWADFPLPAPIV
uniref:CCHC-type domain-containing protein n=1 Tax=Xiphophorus maculatus TaxID=8083 RepID=A0A3B5QIF6_XIPMA